jgi:hypothetical protein
VQGAGQFVNDPRSVRPQQRQAPDGRIALDRFTGTGERGGNTRRCQTLKGGAELRGFFVGQKNLEDAGEATTEPA